MSKSSVGLSATFHLTHDCNLRCTYCYTGLIESFSKELEDFDQKTISLAEMQQLDRLAASGKAYVMPISFMDRRLCYGDYWDRPKNWGDYYSEASAPPDLLDSLQIYQQKQAALPDSLQNQPKVWH